MSQIFLLIIGLCLAAVVVGAPREAEEEHSFADPEYCNYHGLLIKKGETVPGPIGECIKVTCHSTNPFSISALTCPSIFPNPESNCYISERDLTKPYPHCCPKIICEDDEE